MSFFLSILGLVLILVTMLDVIWTTITTKGSGFLSSQWVYVLRSLFFRLYQCSGRRDLLVLLGPATLVSVGLFWLLGLWAGWFLLLLSLGGIEAANTGQAANVAQYLYYTGMTLSTLGIGDYVAGNDLTRLLTSVAAFNGLVLVTLIITYAIPMVGSITARQKTAYSIFLLGGTTDRLVDRFQGEETMGDLAEFLRGATSDILQCAEQRFAYPLLDCFHNLERELSLGLQLAILDEALQRITATPYVRDDRKIRFQISYFRGGVMRYLNSRTGIPTENVSDQKRQRALLEVVLNEGWTWSDVRRS